MRVIPSLMSVIMCRKDNDKCIILRDCKENFAIFAPIIVCMNVRDETEE